MIHIPRTTYAARAIVEYLDLQEYRSRSIYKKPLKKQIHRMLNSGHDEVVERMKSWRINENSLAA